MKIKKLKLLAMAMLFLSSSASFADQCATLYDFKSFTGARWSVEDGASDPSIGRMISRRSWHGHLHGWRGRDISWNDRISSVKVQEGCSLTIYEHNHFKGGNLRMDGTKTAKSFFEFDLDNKTSSFKCSCTGDITANIVHAI